MLAQILRLRPLFNRGDKLRYLGLLALMMVGALVDVIGVGAVPAFVAALAVPEKIMAYPMAASTLQALGIANVTDLVLWGCGALILVFALKNAFLTFLFYAQVRMTEHHRVRMSERLFAAYMRAPYEFHMVRNSAVLLRNVDAESKEIFIGVINPLLNLIMGGMMTAGIAILLFATTPWNASVGLVMVGGGSWAFLRVFKGKLKRYGVEAKHERKETIKAVNQGLSALVDARVLGREEYLIAAFRRSMAHFAYVDRLRQVIGKASTPILETISVAGLLLIVILLVLSGADTAALVPMLALFGAAIVRLRATLSQMVAAISQMQYSIAAIPNVVDDLNLLEVSAGRRVKSAAQDRGSKLPFQRALELDHVTFSYQGAQAPALQDVTLEIEKGSSVAFVGSTGSGKTTLINVILGLLHPQEGSILLDGTDISKNLRGWYRNVGYVPQTIFLLDDTIRRNIAFGLPDEEIDDAQLRTAIQAAQLEEFVEGLESGWDTVVGERGVRLSGGQRQRVGLARALYHNPEVLVMDEATSALDNHTEGLVMRALNHLKQGRTIIIVAHRLNTVQNCDRIYFMREGRIDAVGSYDELCYLHEGFRQMAGVG